MSKNILKIIGFFVIGMIGGIFADQIFWPYFIEKPLFQEYDLEKTPVYVSETREIFVQESVALEGAIKKTGKAVVGVSSQAVVGQILNGSGLVVTSDGLVVTLAELVPQGFAFSFSLNGKEYDYQILKRDLIENLALIKIEGTNFSTVGFADFKEINLGERVFLVSMALDNKIVNQGIIKSFDEDIVITNIVEDRLANGSALFNIAGELVGLNTVAKDGQVISIPASKIKEFIGI